MTRKGYYHVAVLLVLFRVLNTFLIHTYFDPDEFWQTLEPAYCLAFRSHEGYDCQGYTWEWKRRANSTVPDNLIAQSLWGPIRPHISIMPTYLFYTTLKRLRLDFPWLVARGPMIVQALFFAAPMDLAILYISQQIQVQTALFCSLSSWFTAYCTVRTFSNNQEAFCVLMAVALVAPELLSRKSCKNQLMRSSLAFWLGGISVSIRFTCIAAFVPMGVLLSLRQDNLYKKVEYLLLPCALFGAVGIATAMLFDRYFYGFWTIPQLGSFHFNAILDNAGLYGTHPWYWYIVEAVPVIAGLLLPFLVMDIWMLIRAGPSSIWQRNLWIITICYIGVMSANAHKEYRYIFPVLPLFCLLAAPHLNHFLQPDPFQRGALFVVPNVIALAYLGLYHQSAPIVVNKHIRQLLKDHPSSHNTITIHYLTGACHSTPLFSHLHVPYTVDTWSLDCSPSCRADPDAICEYEQMHQNPLDFIQRTYYGDEQKNIPDFLVTISNYQHYIHSSLHDLGLFEITRFPQNVNGMQLMGLILGSDFHKPNFSHITLFPWLEVSLEEMVLYAKDWRKNERSVSTISLSDEL